MMFALLATKITLDTELNHGTKTIELPEVVSSSHLRRFFSSCQSIRHSCVAQPS